MESLEQKKRRLYGKKVLPVYLRELNHLVNTEVTEKDLLSIVDTDHIVYKGNDDCTTFLFSFYDKNKLRTIFENLCALEEKQCFLRTIYSVDCGVLALNNILEFNIDFEFQDEHSGLITILSGDLKNKLILDFYEKNDHNILEIECLGENWGQYQKRFGIDSPK